MFLNQSHENSSRQLASAKRNFMRGGYGWHAAEPVNRYVALVVFTLAFLISCYDVVAQTTASGRRLTMQAGESRGLMTKDAFGKPCLDIETASRAHVSNPKIYDHVVSVMNRCLKPLKLKVCYFGSDRCTELDVPGMKRKDAIFGVGTNMFRVSYTEKR